MSELLKQSNDSLQEYLDEQEQVESERFKVTDESSANWALRKIAQKEQQIKANNELAAAEEQKIEAWRKQENEKAQNDIDFFQSYLAEYAMDLKKKDPKFKTLKLPNGELSFRKQQPEWILDDEKVIKALKESGKDDLIKVTEKPKKDEIKKAFKAHGNKAINPETGEVVDGITIEERPEKFGVKTQ